METTFVMVKPDAVARNLSGEILARFERRGFDVVGLKKVVMSRDAAEEHYSEHCDRPFFADLVEFITSGPVVMMAIRGEGAIGACRMMMGTTNPRDSAPGTIRGDYALDLGQNVIHGSDGTESAVRELGIHFTGAEILG
ncbi:MAG: nucleoside-diphosphate kinase [Thermoleophilia bacterium]|nr:nucleoside-diphosphate kinase [Thermoleophilia bacterium]